METGPSMVVILLLVFKAIHYSTASQFSQPWLE